MRRLIGVISIPWARLHEKKIKEMGYQMVIYPAHTLFFALKGIREMLVDLKGNETIVPWLEQMIDFNEWQRVTRVPEVEVLEKKYTHD